MFGPSGTGKTLTVRAVAGLVRPSDGRIAASGEPLFDRALGLHVPPERRRVGYVPQHVALFPHLSALDNVAFGLRARGDGRGAREEAERWLDRLGVAHLGPRRPRELSGGEAQRVALARALAPSPRLLLLDEPFSSLDMATRREMRRVVRAVQEESAVPMLFVTHSPGEAIEMGHRLVRYGESGSLEEGPPEQLVADSTRVRHDVDGWGE
jgi:molybdate transport system ATP-binding protein